MNSPCDDTESGERCAVLLWSVEVVVGVGRMRLAVDGRGNRAGC